MKQPHISKEEFTLLIQYIQEALDRQNLDALLVYGDEYRKENLRYVSNFWPIFERSACFIPKSGQPTLAIAPEGEKYAREMTIWGNVRNVKEFACVSVAEEIDYPLAEFSSFKDILTATLGGGRRLGLVGLWDMPSPILDRVKEAINGLEIINSDDILNNLRLIKTPAEIEILRECGRIACLGHEKLMKAAVPGNTELMAGGAGEGAARMAGAEDINFLVMGSGRRTETVIGRPTEKIIEAGDMIMASLAVQYQGYVTTVEFPFVAGKASDKQKRFLNILLEAANEQLKFLKAGVTSGEMVGAIKAIFKKHNVSDYDVYPPMHGTGLAEAESPYPDENSTYPLKAGMCVNSDISLFGHPDGSNRIEEGFVIDTDGPKSLTPLIRQLCENGVG